MNICMILTGGTIGSTVGERAIGLDANRAKLLDFYERKYQDNLRVDVVVPFQILSENLEIPHMLQLAELVEEKDGLGYDGIVITHGSDTLQYTAAFLDWRNPKPETPVFLVASNYVLEDERANGLDNFRGALLAINGGIGAGVYVSYRNPGEETQIHRGRRLLPHVAFSDRVASVGDDILGQIEKERFVPRAAKDGADLPPLPVLTPGRAPRMLLFSVYPGLGELLEQVSLVGIDGVIFHTYHSGTLPTADAAFAAFCRRAAGAGVSVFACGTYLDVEYQSAGEFDGLGIVRMPGLSSVSLYTGLLCSSIYARTGA